MILFLIVTGSNWILPFVTQSLNPLIKILSFICRVGKTVLPLKILIIISISFLLCVTYLLVFTDCDITLPKPNVSCIKYKTFISLVLCVITKHKSPLLLIIKDPSPSVNPTNQHKKLFEGNKLLGK
jgi:hypothetical protein